MTTEGRVPGVVYVNGSFEPTDQASVSVFDHGFLYGDGVFDTSFARFGWIFKLDEHMDRLERSLKAVALELPMSMAELRAATIETAARNGHKDAYIKVVASRGVSAEPLMDPRNCTPTVVIFARPYLSLAGAGVKERGLVTKLTSLRRVSHTALDPRIKSLNYLNLVMSRMEAFAAGCDEALIVDEDGYVCEAPGYNIFALIGGELVTPDQGILEGITRATVFDLADDLGITARIGRLAPYDLFTAEEAFLTSTAGGLIPIVKVDGRTVGTGKPGPVLARMDKRYEELLSQGWKGTPIPGLR
ncbi:MAG: aminotransferase class IV [Chloroflexota bacterium]